jgi:hypothetical protein
MIIYIYIYIYIKLAVAVTLELTTFWINVYINKNFFENGIGMLGVIWIWH